MKLIYIAGPYRAATPWQVEQNVRISEFLGLRVAEHGAMPIIPHANNRFFNGLLTEQFWLDGTLEMLRRCDALMLVNGFRGSKGTEAEINEALRLGKPVYIDRADAWLAFDAWLAETNGGTDGTNDQG